jgi:hypothetical protein
MKIMSRLEIITNAAAAIVQDGPAVPTFGVEDLPSVISSPNWPAPTSLPSQAVVPPAATSTQTSTQPTPTVEMPAFLRDMKPPPPAFKPQTEADFIARMPPQAREFWLKNRRPIVATAAAVATPSISEKKSVHDDVD